jgi:hypothetical protein
LKHFLPFLLAFSLAVAPAFASPGDMAGVLAHCGAPDADISSTSEVNSLPERSLTYGGVRLNFQQLQGDVAGGWSFTTAWAGHFPLTKGDVSQRMPCFRDGIEEAQIRNQNVLTHADPGIVDQSAAQTQPHGAFGIAHWWLIIFLIGVLAIFAVALPRHRRMVKGPELADRPFRRPRLAFIRTRRKPRLPKRL